MEGARIGDFVRIVLLYHYGGVYLDGDVVTCHDLDDLVKHPGLASFPMVFPTHAQIVNCVMSGPPKHYVFEIALEIMKENKELATMHILEATGPALVAAAVDVYLEVTKAECPVRLMSGDVFPEPPNGSDYFECGNIRLGAVMRGGRESSRGLGTLKTLGLVHLHWRSWMNEDHKLRQTECNTNYDLIDDFLDFTCKKSKEIDSRNWSDCGEEQDE